MIDPDETASGEAEMAFFPITGFTLDTLEHFDPSLETGGGGPLEPLVVVLVWKATVFEDTRPKVDTQSKTIFAR